MRREEGFALLEVLMAILILAVGVFGVMTLALDASKATGANRTREGATNLGREVVENILSLPYPSVDPSNVRSMLQARPALAPANGYSGWTVVRRQIPYTLSVDGCYMDDPSDGLGSHDGTFCAGSAAGTNDSRPIDHKRFGVTVSWTQSGVQRSIRQSTVLGSKGESEIPAVSSLTSGGGVTITSTSVTSIDFSATTSASATGVAWSVDDSVRGLASGGGTSWSFTWNISGLPDGQYVVGAKSYNNSGTFGTPLSLTITLNRTAPSPPQGFVAGWNRNSGTVDSEWLASPEPDTVGYTVYRQQTYPTTGAITKVNCGTLAAPLYITTETQCADASPIIPSATGRVNFRSTASGKAIDQTSLTVTKPTGVVTNDVLVATVAQSANKGFTPPAGWTQIASTLHGTNTQLVSFYHVAGASEPASYTFTVTDNSKRKIVGGIVAYSGVNTSSPIDASGGTFGNSGNAVSPSITTTLGYDMVINPVAFTGVGTGSQVTPASGMTERFDYEAKPITSDYSDMSQANAGSTGTKTSTLSSSNSGWVSQLIALKPGASGVNDISVNYWVVAVDRDAAGNYREGPVSSAVNAYAANLQPNPIVGGLNCTTNADGSTTLSWTQPAQPGDPDSGDSIAFDRVYRDDVRYDRTGTGTENSFIDPNPGGTHDYYLTTVDRHLAESTPSGTVTC